MTITAAGCAGADTPYGPYADGFSQRQHPFGPFEAALAKLRAQKPH